MTGKEMRARLGDDQTASKNNPFIFIHHRADGTLRFPTRKAQRREATFTNTRGFYWSNSLEEDSPSNIDAKEIRS